MAIFSRLISHCPQLKQFTLNCVNVLAKLKSGDNLCLGTHLVLIYPLHLLSIISSLCNTPIYTFSLGLETYFNYHDKIEFNVKITVLAIRQTEVSNIDILRPHCKVYFIPLVNIFRYNCIALTRIFHIVQILVCSTYFFIFFTLDIISLRSIPMLCHSNLGLMKSQKMY